MAYLYFYISDKFLVFKTPLSEKYDDQVPEECVFTPSLLLAYADAQKVKKRGSARSICMFPNIF